MDKVKITIWWDSVISSDHYGKINVELKTNALIQLYVREGIRLFKVLQCNWSPDKNGFRKMSVVPVPTRKPTKMDLVFKGRKPKERVDNVETFTMPKTLSKGDLFPITECENSIRVYRVIKVEKVEGEYPLVCIVQA